VTYQLSWLVENRVLLQVAYGEITIEELNQLAAEINVFLQMGTAPIHIIVDARHLKMFPQGVLRNYHAYENLNPKQLGWVVQVSDNQVLQYLTSTVSHLIGFNLRTFADMPAALNFLQHAEPSLNWNEATINVERECHPVSSHPGAPMPTTDEADNAAVKSALSIP
jgi:hypothetical protein